MNADDIKARAIALGFDLCGIAAAEAHPELSRLREWLDRGYAGEMIYLHKSAEARADIRNFLSTARSVIVTGTIYYTDDPAAAASGIARYAWGRDYHIVLAERLERLVEWMREASGRQFDAAIFVDKHHVQERVFAQHAGLGWIGKNTCLINPEIGSWIFLAGVAVSLELPADQPGVDQCGACTLCLDACPTGALIDAYELDATKCISYLTIELDGPIPESQRDSIGSHVFGCDICQDVCPWNLAPLATLDPVWQPRSRHIASTAGRLWNLSDVELHGLVRGSAMTRTALSRLRRNLAVVIANSGDAGGVDVLDRPGRGQRRAAMSADTPLVREHVDWAKRKLGSEVPQSTTKATKNGSVSY